MTQEKIDRINELARKSRTEGLTDEEKDEQTALRNEYRQSVTGNLAAQLKNTYVMTQTEKSIKSGKMGDDMTNDELFSLAVKAAENLTANIPDFMSEQLFRRRTEKFLQDVILRTLRILSLSVQKEQQYSKLFLRVILSSERSLLQEVQTGISENRAFRVERVCR